MFWNIFARSAPSADNCQATSLFMINDGGIWLLRRLRGKDAAALVDTLPRSWTDWSEADWLRAADTVKVRVHEDRLSFPRIFPILHRLEQAALQSARDRPSSCPLSIARANTSTSC